jgi:hypothetical protein
MPSEDQPGGREHWSSLGDMLDETARPAPGLRGQTRRDVMMARAEAERAARLAGYKSPLRRLVERLLPRRQGRGS